MTPDQLKTTAIKIYGRKKWKPSLARDLGLDTSTVFRMMHREQVPGPVEVAVRGLLDHRQREIELERAARKLVPRKFRRRAAPAGGPRKPRKAKAVKTEVTPEQSE